MRRPRAWLLPLALSCSCTASVGESAAPLVVPPPVPRIFHVHALAGGGFSPDPVYLHDGDTVVWHLIDGTDTILPTLPSPSPSPTGCPAPRTFDPSRPNEFTGPMPVGASGVFSLGPDGPGLVEGACADGGVVATSDGGAALCTGGAPYASLQSTWQSPDLTGVFIRLRWNEVQLAPGSDDASFDFSALDRELAQAVAHHKLYSLAVKAGHDGTPDWLFTTEPYPSPLPNPLPPLVARTTPNAGVTRLLFRDSGSDDDTACGPTMYLGNPTEAAYQAAWDTLLTKLSQHLMSRNEWYRALAYIKISGANLFSDENRLPKRCTAGCGVCNPRVWAAAGYTPSKLYAFYAWQQQRLLQLFPGKAQSYQVIQDGFPLVNELGNYQNEDGVSAVLDGGVDGAPLPRGTEQTEQILANGEAADGGALFVVQHNGLGPSPSPTTCLNLGLHPAVGPYDNAGSGCPNQWVLGAGADGQLTGFQTRNLSAVGTPLQLDQTFENAWYDSDAAFVEIYEQVLWSVTNGGGALPLSGQSIGQWGDQLDQRRHDFLVGETGLPDPNALTWSHQFHRTAPGPGDQLFVYFNGGRCDPTRPRMGHVVVLP